MTKLQKTFGLKTPKPKLGRPQKVKGGLKATLILRVTEALKKRCDKAGSDGVRQVLENHFGLKG